MVGINPISVPVAATPTVKTAQVVISNEPPASKNPFCARN